MFLYDLIVDVHTRHYQILVPITTRKSVEDNLHPRVHVGIDIESNKISHETDRIGFASLAQDTLRFDYLGKWIHALVMNGDMDPSGIPPPIWRIWDDSTGDRRQEIVFIGIDLDRKSIESELESFRCEKEC